MNHSFDIEFAEEFGVEIAIFIYYFNIFLKEKESIIHDNKIWVKIPIKDLKLHFPYFSERAIRYNISKAIEFNIFITENLNKNKHDRTRWLTFSDDFMKRMEGYNEQ